MQWEPVIGLEIHSQLATKSKIFSAASTAYGAKPNTQACAVDLGLPGVLPVLNKEVVSMAIKFGLAVNAQIAPRSIFARKNYFYPDLPKGYQISQYELPIVEHGNIKIELEDGLTKTIGITRAHLEEDAGKSLHEDFHGQTGIDLNRAGTPLLEIVSEPDMRSSFEAVAYMKKIHTLVKYLGICDGNMQEGSFRCDANVSVRRKGAQEFGTRTELKNINSFRFVERAIEYEISRQISLLEENKKIIQQTRLYDPDKNETRPMRSKEEAMDYRYFPDPDLLPVEIKQESIDKLKQSLPELPDEKKDRFSFEYGLTSQEAAFMTSSRELADYFEAAQKISDGETKLCTNWIIGDLTGALNKHKLDIAQSPVSAAMLGKLIKRISDNTVSGKIAKQVFESMWQQCGDPDEIIKKMGGGQVSDAGAIEPIIDEVLANNPKELEQYKAGKHKLMGFFVGEIMKKSRGKANPKLVNELLNKKLNT